MKIAEDADKGLMAKALDDSDENILRFGRMKYSPKYGCFMSDCILNLTDFVSEPTKAKAIKRARKMGWTSAHVEKIGSRFWSCWGIRNDLRDTYFLATYD